MVGGLVAPISFFPYLTDQGPLQILQSGKYPNWRLYFVRPSNIFEGPFIEGSIVVTALLSGASRGRRHNKDQEPRPHQRLDIQGLRMVAVMLVVLSHLFDWPRGGFIGVDVFFVISGFLITGSLMHTVEKTGRISFSSFYRRRVRRILPAATLVLAATIAAAYFIYGTARFKSTTLDAVAAFFFVSNWRFGIEGTDYFTASGPVSPLQHYWSLSVEEQFYFVWPAVIFVIAVVAARMAWTGRARIALAGGVMAVVVMASFIYSVLDTASNPTWAYFSTLTRVWELGVGALLAITISYFERIPDLLRPLIAWAGLIMIAVGSFAISEGDGGFPAPWAAVPVAGAALIICAGVSGEQKYLQVLTNRVSTYIGDISYSLYLWHWPVIILLAALMDSGIYYYTSALFLMFGLSIAAYHFFENPIRASKWLETSAERKDRSFLDVSRWRLPTLKMSETNQSIGIGALALVVAGIAAFALVPTQVSVAPVSAYVPASQSGESTDGKQVLGPAQTALAADIEAAVSATAWPDLSPSMDDAIGGAQAPAEILRCGNPTRLTAKECTWGSPTAPKTMVLVGDSIAMTYAQPLKNFVEASNGQWKIQVDAMFGCRFVDLPVETTGSAIGAACTGHRDDSITLINEIRPDAVVIANNYTSEEPSEWTAAMKRFVDRFSTSAKNIVFLSAPPASINIGDCYTRAAKPADCLGKVIDQWTKRASAETQLAADVNGHFVDSRAWFCTPSGYCPSFVGTTPTRRDRSHMTPEYQAVISPAVAETLHELGL
ncbi:UNVERIFIED_ORG: peptidoglycan/LPS O-acetylase OafA/YrhL [Nocardia globerula]|uniref:Peptidoglycan/LPS O-acetylase OafA/YrhL n=1 Tax=Nocardia globerula TaxID=1818 RepID=A0A652YVG8_NOCGL|nr:acyltransferase family protein [Rhodococcus globerulus]PVX63986.1 peptidoglycan/LPS O-acetylase OafA/YrhL [Rhodococcus globerulus]